MSGDEDLDDRPNEVGRRYFTVDGTMWPKVCALGVNPASMYLLMASGTGSGHTMTHWSVSAANKYLNIGRPRAKAAIAEMLRAGVIEQSRGGKHPIYRLIHSDEADQNWIWLPSAIVRGIGREVPPVALLRHADSIDALRLFVELYGQQHMTDNCGIEWRPKIGIRLLYDRDRVFQAGALNIWSFSPSEHSVSPDFPPAAAFKNERGEIDARFERAFSLIVNQLRLAYFVGHLVDRYSETGEVMFPCPDEGECEPEERLIADAAHITATERLPDFRAELHDKMVGGQLVPVPSHYSDAQLVGILRMRYLPHTNPTLQWFARKADAWPKLAESIYQMGRDSIQMPFSFKHLQYES